jgi:hypothetical protein
MGRSNLAHSWSLDYHHHFHKDRLHGCLELSSASDDLTLEEVCPIWSEKFRKGLDETDRFILSRDSKKCLVGEAWGFTGRQAGYYIAPLIPLIGCWTCIKYGQKFGRIAKKKEPSSNTSNDHADFEPLISEFLRHWNQKHKSITKSRIKQLKHTHSLAGDNA